MTLPTTSPRLLRVSGVSPITRQLQSHVWYSLRNLCPSPCTRSSPTSPASAMLPPGQPVFDTLTKSQCPHTWQCYCKTIAHLNCAGRFTGLKRCCREYTTASASHSVGHPGIPVRFSGLRRMANECGKMWNTASLGITVCRTAVVIARCTAALRRR